MCSESKVSVNCILLAFYHNIFGMKCEMIMFGYNNNIVFKTLSALSLLRFGEIEEVLSS